MCARHCGGQGKLYDLGVCCCYCCRSDFEWRCRNLASEKVELAGLVEQLESERNAVAAEKNVTADRIKALEVFI